MDLEEYVRKQLIDNQSEQIIQQQLAKIIQQYKHNTTIQSNELAKTIIKEIKNTNKTEEEINSLIGTYPHTNIHMGQFGVGSRGKGDFYVHSKIAHIIQETKTQAIINPTQQDDGGVVKIDTPEKESYITTAIDGIHSRLSEYPFLAGFHTARATLRDVCVMGAKPIALISDIHLADDGDIGKILDYTAGICTVSELVNVPLVSGSTLRVGGDMVLGDRLVGAVGAVGSSTIQPTSRKEAQISDIILLTEGAGGGTITTTALYNNFPEVIEETLNTQFIHATNQLIKDNLLEKTNAMTDITNGGIRGDANEINKTTKLGIEIDKEKIYSLINPKVLQMLKILDIDPLGISTDSLMIIVSPKYAEKIIKSIQKVNIKIKPIGKITDTGKTVLIDKNKKEIIKPEFREAAYTPIKKLIGDITPKQYEEMKYKIDKATQESINKKNRIIKKIRIKESNL
ncbi:MAG: AIR synthase-related protein [Methanobacteriaceae archaeon]|nr:AIR synthase-related protein [Methanobacteriaceae archaeon]